MDDTVTASAAGVAAAEVPPALPPAPEPSTGASSGAAATTKPTTRRHTPGASATNRVLRAEMFVFLAIRAVHLSQAVISVATAPTAYRSGGGVAIGVAAAAVVECGAIVMVDLRRQCHSWAVARADVVFSLLALVVLASATPGASRTTSLFWMLPYAVGAAAGLGFTKVDVSAIVLTTALGAAYLAVNGHVLGHGGGPMATAIINALSIPSFYVVVIVLVHFINRFAVRYDETTALMVRAEREVAEERERRRLERVIHDSVLQLLEAMASGRATSAEDMRRWARVEARALRSRLGTGVPVTHLVDDVRQTASDAELATGLRVEVTWEERLAQPGARVAEALVGAAREALTNTAKHARVSRATVRVQSRDGGVEVVVRDEGCGFDPGARTEGFGTSQSISARMAEVGGRATIASTQGLGTTVRLWGPLA